MERTMAEFDLDKMADRVAEKALDEFTYNGKTIREWVELMVTVESVVEVRMVEEFEKIKEKINESSFETYEKNSEEPIVCNYTINVMQIIDKHIAKLKGKQE